MLIKFTTNVLLGTGLGVVVGAFLPSVGRKIKAEWVKETEAFKYDVASQYDSAASVVKEEVKKL